MEQRYVQQFKKGSLEMILLSLIGRRETYGYEIITELNRKRGDNLSHSVSPAGGGADPVPSGAGGCKRRL